MTKRRPQPTVRTYVSDDGHTWAHYLDQRKRVDLGVVTDPEQLPAMIEAARSLPGPREVREWDAEQEAKRATEDGDDELERTVASWFDDGRLT